MEISSEKLHHIIEGAALLGSGGGGNKAAAYALLKYIVETAPSGKVQLLSALDHSFESSAMGCVIADIGANSAQEEKQYEAIATAFNELSLQMQRTIGASLAFVLPIETGPENCMVPFVVAAHYGVPVLDIDGAGRAVPVLPLATFSELPPCPAVIANDKGDFLLLQIDKVADLDSMLRPITGLALFGNSGSLALWPSRIDSLLKYAVRNSLSYAMACGEIIDCLQKGIQIGAGCLSFVNERKACLLGQGIVQSIQNKEEGAFDYSQVVIHDVLSDTTISVLVQNESLILYNSNQPGPMLTAPASIGYLKTDGSAITNAEIKQGDEVFLLAIDAHEALKQPGRLLLFKEQLQEFAYFGELKYQLSVEEGLADLLVRLIHTPV
ncbi:DUF917 family protein [Pedobacter foliorum]|uniref:S-methyl thiohydantoin desulfurase domain-containing protein n=1 Tax=Pedobacter foliorum TaxID=2739058 RepID=UPI001566A5E8|nr:DUF917 family protein [Pedobacter foliorum]NRF40466.1 DUF917 family protein [Pedobacter foliorum]